MPKTFPCCTAKILSASGSTSKSLAMYPGALFDLSRSHANLSIGRLTRSAAAGSSVDLDSATIVASHLLSTNCSLATVGNIFSTTGAWMEIPLKGGLESFNLLRNGRSKSVRSFLPVFRNDCG